MHGHELIIGTTLPHSDLGDPECCGCLNRIVQGDLARIVCSECSLVVKTAPAADLRRTLDRWNSRRTAALTPF